MQLIACVPARKILAFMLFCICFTNANAQLTANFSADRLSGCAPFEVRFKDESTGNPTSWKWSLGNNTSSIERNPSTSYLNPGTYKVTLEVKNASGTSTKELTITVYSAPTIDFSASALSGCYPLPVTFTDKSEPGDGTIKTWRWDFGDGNTTEERKDSKAEHTYLNAGTYKVALQVTNSFGCTSAATPVEINISKGISPQFSVSAPSSCKLPMTFTFSNASTGTGNLTYEWDFDDGTTSTLMNPPPHTFTTAGEYHVKLNVRSDNGCVSSYTNTIKVSEANSSFTAPTVSCVGVPVSFLNTSSPNPIASTWNFGDGTTSNAINPEKTYTTPGIYTVILNNDFGSCQGTETKTIQILPRPAIDFIADETKSCQPYSAKFSANITGAVTYEWNFGDGTTSNEQNPTHAYTTENNFTVTLTVMTVNGCRFSYTKSDYIQIKPPVVRITNNAVEGCLPYPYTPALQIETIDPIIEYKWSFGDGGTGTGAAYTHTYTKPGRYDLILQYTTKGGCTYTITEPGAILVGNKPVVDFKAAKKDFCAFDGVTFTDLSTVTPAADKWLWDFGDGSSSILQNPHHMYNDVGFMDVTLTVWSNGCKSEPLTKSQIVKPKAPVANFNIEEACGPNPYYRKFRDASVQAETWAWNFGDGTTSNDRNPEKVYTKKGIYEVSLTVTNSNGCSYTATSSVKIIDESQTLKASDKIVCHQTEVRFEIQGHSANVKSYEWNLLAPGSRPDILTVSQAFQKGIYNVSVIVTDINNCTKTLTEQITVIAPTADLELITSNVCINSPVSFKDKSTPFQGYPIVKWEMNYGDGTSEVIAPPDFQHIYNAGGTPELTYKVTDSKGCTDMIRKAGMVTINDPKANFTSPDLFSCTGKNIRFVNQSTGAGLSYKWHFGDGTTSSVQTPPPHQYNAEGAYSIKLEVEDQIGCRNEKEVPDYILINNPVAKIINPEVSKTCPPLDARFTNDSKNYISQQWSFGDGTGSLLKDPSKIYTKPGIYHVVLSVTSHGGCVATDQQTIDIQGPKGSFTYKKLNDCVPVKVEFQGSTKDNASFIWDFNNGNTVSTKDNKIIYDYETPGTFLPTMILKDNESDCRVPYQGEITIEAYGVKTDFIMDKDFLCDKGSVSFTDKTISNDRIIDYKWTFTDGNISSQKNPVHNFLSTGLFDVQLKVTTEHGCEDHSSNALKIVQSPKAKITGPGPACVPALFDFAGQLDNADTSTTFKWEWDFANGQKSDVQDPQPIQYSNANDYLVKLKLTNSSGCMDETQYAIKVYPLPELKVTPDFVLCRDQPRVLQATGADTYNWQASSSISCTNCPNPTVNPIADTKYMVTGKTTFGCEANAEVNVTVQQKFTVSVNLGDTLCIGEKYGLKATGADLYQWTPATGLNNPTAANPIAQPGTTTTYTVTGRDKNGCFTDSKSIPLVVYPYPKVDLGPDQTLAVGYSLDLKPTLTSDVTDIKWSPAVGLSCITCPSPTASPKQNITYKIEVMNEGGCKAIDMMSIFMTCKGENMFLPNTFSPNGDANNETFYPRGRGLAYVKNFRIFNRWGEIVFEAANFQVNDRSKGWNGMHKGKPASLDVYVYTIDVVCENNEILNFKGDVTLLR
jgi:gliding motility-associated-like protein